MCKTPGQLAYEEDCKRQPHYPGQHRYRLTWEELDDIAKWSWERNPTPREYKNNGW